MLWAIFYQVCSHLRIIQVSRGLCVACVNFVVGRKKSCLRFTTLLDFQIKCWQFLYLNMASFLIVYILCTAKLGCGSTRYNATTASEVEITLPLNKICTFFFALGCLTAVIQHRIILNLRNHSLSTCYCIIFNGNHIQITQSSLNIDH